MQTDNEKLKKEPGNNGGARPGAGRKPGGKNQNTIRREKVLAAFRKRVEKHADILFDAQMTLARGVSSLWKVPKEIEIKRNRQGEEYEVEKRGKPVMVTAQFEIAKYLEGDYKGDSSADYYYITTDKPDNRAIDSMLDRTFGKATQPLSVDPDDPEGATVVGMVVYKPDKLADDYETTK